MVLDFTAHLVAECAFILTGRKFIPNHLAGRGTQMKNIRTIIFLKLIIILLVCFGVSGASAQPLLEQPSLLNSYVRQNEVLEYSIKIRGIPAGTQKFQVNGKKILNGQEVYHLKSTSKIKKFFSIFYSFSNRSESFIQSENLYPLHYTKRIKDGGYKGNIDVDFDWDNQVARIVKDQKRTEIRIPPGIQDELSMIYLLRTREIEVGHEYHFPFLSGNKTLRTTVLVLRNEKLKTVLGTLNTIVIKTIPKNITIWLTDDSLRIPVKIEARTKIGKLVSKLKAVS